MRSEPRPLSGLSRAASPPPPGYLGWPPLGGGFHTAAGGGGGDMPEEEKSGTFNLFISLKGLMDCDPSGRGIQFVDIKLKAPPQLKLLILKRTF